MIGVQNMIIGVLVVVDNLVECLNIVDIKAYKSKLAIKAVDKGLIIVKSLSLEMKDALARLAPMVACIDLNTSK